MATPESLITEADIDAIMLRVKNTGWHEGVGFRDESPPIWKISLFDVDFRVWAVEAFRYTHTPRRPVNWQTHIKAVSCQVASYATITWPEYKANRRHLKRLIEHREADQRRAMRDFLVDSMIERPFLSYGLEMDAEGRCVYRGTEERQRKWWIPLAMGDRPFKTTRRSHEPEICAGD